jgi:dTDP-6-deoxy-L-talose 4-dehydrogenase (NAD+)
MDHFEHELPSHYGFVRAAVSAGVSSVVVTGTCLEYGLVSGEVDEDRQPRPTTPYGFAKDALRRELEFLRESTPFDLTWARLFYLYGPGQRTTSLIPRLEAAARAGDRSFPLSAGEHIRDYSRVEDVARDLADLAIQRLDAGIVNVCSGRGVRVLDFARQYAAEQRLTIDVTSSVDAAQSYESRAFWGDRRKLDNLLSHRAGAR